MHWLWSFVYSIQNEQYYTVVNSDMKIEEVQFLNERTKMPNTYSYSELRIKLSMKLQSNQNGSNEIVSFCIHFFWETYGIAGNEISICRRWCFSKNWIVQFLEKMYRKAYFGLPSIPIFVNRTTYNSKLCLQYCFCFVFEWTRKSNFSTGFFLLMAESLLTSTFTTFSSFGYCDVLCDILFRIHKSSWTLIVRDR